MNPIQIIGMGQGIKDLTPAHFDMINQCDVLVAGSRLLDNFHGIHAEKIRITRHVDELIQSLEQRMNKEKIVILASGDPLFHGIGSSFSKRLSKEKFKIHPNISSVCAAFAALKIPWHDARVISLHGAHQTGFSFSQLAGEHKVAFLTDPDRSPGFIADQLANEGLYDFEFYVLEHLGDDDKQNIQQFDNIDLIQDRHFSDPNIVVLIRKGNASKKEVQTHIGMDDDLFKHGRGLITKSEIRSISLSKLKLIRKDHILWDIGSGSGSVGIEASFQLPWGQVYAMEKNSDRITDIIHNISNFNCSNVKIIHTQFPDGTNELKTPDRIFVGGGGRELESVLTHACERLAQYGVIVINTVLLQNLETALELLKNLNFTPEVVQVQVSRGKSMPFGERFEALNPVWIISGIKPGNKESHV